MFRKISLLAIALLIQLSAVAKEGMWLPLLLKSLNEEDMQSRGFKLTAEDLYSINKSSLKDAVIRFGNGCTGEVVSDRGLLFTNHHCGYGQIQAHSSVDNDYLTEGFWAMNQAEELPNPGLTVTFIVNIADVTKKVLQGVNESMTEAERQKKINQNIETVRKEAEGSSKYKAMIKPFFYGNEYYMFLTEVYKDIRLVGAPPSSIGKFGGDTDNWMWPRHTGDFSVFRIYADKNNQPAEYAADNVPFHPKKHFKISLKGVQQGDFTLVYGFPGTTKQYLTSDAVEYVTQVTNPAKIQLRENSLAIMDAAMKASDEVRIKYAAKYARISNYYKKWIGENNGLRKLNALEKKKAFEKEFTRQLAKNPALQKKYGTLLPTFQSQYKELEKYAFATDYFRELYFYAPELIRFVSNFRKLQTNIEQLEQDKQLDNEVEKLKSATQRHFKNYDLATDQKLFATVVAMYQQKVDPSLHPEVFQMVQNKYNGDWGKYAEYVYNKSIFVREASVNDLLSNVSKKTAKKLAKDPAYQFVESFFVSYMEKTQPSYKAISDKIDRMMRDYVKAQREIFTEKTFWPDANSTLRISYGNVEGSNPRDGMEYNYFSTLEGVMEKRRTDVSKTHEFYVHDKLVDLYEKKDFGQYGQEGKMPVCFIASNHTTGGNSGSPVLDGSGNLIGINFDRSWESTMSDIMFNPEQCRNITVDIRYVLFVIDKFAGASHLVEELDLVRN
ncbi:S46 family peptidase [Rapidithrix thailandica]|uniref:Dipeptidyl-peptidase n=1 Tax=Rapidithrix thailandica TaxID=413964 RepID=A0AAW9S673_9BACT